MKTSELAGLGFIPVCSGRDAEITGGFCGDLMSWAMSRAGEGHVWFTVIGNINTVAVASLAEVAAVVVCHGAIIADDALAKAGEEGINILRTELPEFEAAALFAAAFSEAQK